MRVDELREALDEAAGPRPATAPAYRRVVERRQRSRRRRTTALAAVIIAAALPAGIWLVHDRGGDPAEQRVAAGPGVATTTSAPPATNRALPTATAQAQAALDAWRHFPVSKSPRPLIMGAQVNAPEQGFPDNATKDAYESGRFDLAAPLPDGPQRAGGYPLITGQPILDRLKTGGSPGPAAVSQLRITSIRLGSAPFQSDRGTRVLPAWLITFEGIPNPAQVLAVAPSALFDPPTDADGFSPDIAVSPIGNRTLLVTFGGAGPGPGPCGADYAVDAYSSRQAVAIEIEQVSRPSTTVTTRQVAVCAAVGYIRSMKVTLDQPLGARVVVDSNGGAAVAFSVNSHG